MPKALREPELPARSRSGGSASPGPPASPPAPETAADPPEWVPGWVARRPETVAILVSLVGLFVQVVGYSRGWAGDEGLPIVLWYVGFVVVIAPFAALLLVPGRTGHQRLGASLALTLVVYASWLLSNPLMSTRFDENLHVTTLVDLVEHAEFFRLNSMLPVSPHFPGLELATAGVHWLTGLPLFVCQVLVVGASRVTFAAALFLLASRIGRSTTVGAVAILLYAASNQFYFFNAQFSYQTVAIAMVMATFYLLVRAFDSPVERPWSLLVTAQVCLAALAITHHLTSWIMLGTLWVLAAFFWAGKERRRFEITLITAEVATAVVAAWTAVIAPLLIDYLTPIFDAATSQLAGLLQGGAQREIGGGTAGTPTPTWEVMVMFGSLLLWCLMLLPAGWAAWRRKSIGATRARYVPLLIAVAFPTLQLARFSSAASEVADRASTFVFMAMVLVVGAWVASRLHVLRTLVVPGALLLVLGGTILGSGPDWQRVPGPFLAGAEQRSVDSTTVAVAEWAGRYLPEGSNVAADFTFSRVIPNFADVTSVTQPAGFDSVTPMFISESFDQTSLELILRNEVDFVVVDTRLVGETVRSGSFYEGGAGYGEAAATVQPQMVEKFETEPGFELVLDGPVKIYDVRSLRGVAAPFEDRASPGLPGEWTPWQVALTAALVLVAVVLRRRLFDLRRFQAGDAWRFALVVPVAMALGAIGVVLAFAPVAGAVAGAVLLYVLVRLSTNPPALPRRGRTWESRLWLGLTVVLAAASSALALWSTWHGLLDFSALPPPLDGRGE
ncbi:hypothetical protein [Nocardioides sp.]|uniref:hypothetical protein n=1 Tax=Nocardioides sp. TaxID=35761 RepID=UPI001A256893|nr:hypothetical protein [Nocardioides sp.]MBJ7356905.1 hypothetical protein [Nocardioides sp.]